LFAAIVATPPTAGTRLDSATSRPERDLAPPLLVTGEVTLPQPFLAGYGIALDVTARETGQRRNTDTQSRTAQGRAGALLAKANCARATNARRLRFVHALACVTARPMMSGRTSLPPPFHSIA
jgi:hypothetical protein